MAQLAGATFSVDPQLAGAFSRFGDDLISAIREGNNSRNNERSERNSSARNDQYDGVRARPRYDDERHAPPKWSAGTMLAFGFAAALFVLVLFVGIVLLNSGAGKTQDQITTDRLGMYFGHTEEMTRLSNSDSANSRMAEVAKQESKDRVEIKQSDTTARVGEAKWNAFGHSMDVAATVAMNKDDDMAFIRVGEAQAAAVAASRIQERTGPLVVNNTSVNNTSVAPAPRPQQPCYTCGAHFGQIGVPTQQAPPHIIVRRFFNMPGGHPFAQQRQEGCNTTGGGFPNGCQRVIGYGPHGRVL